MEACRVKADSMIDVPVLLIFFNRPHTFIKVFEQVALARPSKLFLYQDGPRDNRPDDLVNITACREIADKIDWQCEVHTLYQERNFGCDPSVYIAIKWFFEHVEQGIILEDDNVPSQSFFPFCKELLVHYANDERICSIAGLNHLESYDPSHGQYDYFCTAASSIWGWATWRRFIDTWDPEYGFLDDAVATNTIERAFLNNWLYPSIRVNGEQFIDRCRTHRASGKAHYETLFVASKQLNHQLTIFPTKNLISNIGNVGESTHGVDDIRKMCHQTQRIFLAKRHTLLPVIKHPPYLVVDDRFIIEKEKLLSGSRLTKPFRRMEMLYRNLRYGNKKEYMKRVFAKLRKAER